MPHNNSKKVDFDPTIELGEVCEVEIRIVTGEALNSGGIPTMIRIQGTADCSQVEVSIDGLNPVVVDVDRRRRWQARFQNPQGGATVVCTREKVSATCVNNPDCAVSGVYDVNCCPPSENQ